MFIDRFSFRAIRKALGCLLAGALCFGNAHAANPENLAAGVEFVAPITMAAVNGLDFGLIDEALNLETIIIGTDNAQSGTIAAGLLLGGTIEAAEVTVTATTGTAINILVDTIVDGTGYALSAFQCDYNGGGTTGTCSGGGLDIASAAAGGITVLIGATLTGDNAASAGNADGSFDVTAAYQ